MIETKNIFAQGQWNYINTQQFAYGDSQSYEKAASFLDRPNEVVEDWGCGTCFARQLFKKSKYVGVDKTWSPYFDKLAYLDNYTTKVDCILMRHVLEHNKDWKKILENAVQSFQKRMCLIIYTPFKETTTQINEVEGIPVISFNKNEITQYFIGLKVTEEVLKSSTDYGQEVIFYLEK